MSSSVKFQQAVDDVRKHGLAHEVGAAVTRGQGPRGYLAVGLYPDEAAAPSQENND